MGTLAEALEILIPVIETVTELPFNDKGVQQQSDATLDLDVEGVWFFSFNENYEYPANGFNDHPIASVAELVLAIQAKRASLDALVITQPQVAIATMTNALRDKLETESNNGTFTSVKPSFSVNFQSSEQMYSGAIGLAVIQVTLLLRSYDG